MLGVLLQDLLGGLNSCVLLAPVSGFSELYPTFLVLLVLIVSYNLPKERGLFRAQGLRHGGLKVWCTVECPLERLGEKEIAQANL
jgi:hypothetical protein